MMDSKNPWYKYYQQGNTIMSQKLMRSIVEKGNLNEFNTLFNEEVNSRVMALIKEMEDEIKAEFDLSEEADIIGKDSDKKVDAEDAKDKGPSQDTDADDQAEEDDEDEGKDLEEKSKDVIYKDGVRYEYDGKTDLYYDSETDVYVTSKALNV